eukprot:11921409-Alexandrium_andersonii.AAC.1
MAMLLPDVPAEVWAEAEPLLDARDLARLQVYWVDTQRRGRRPSPQGPEWSSSVRRARAQAALGEQRAAPGSKRGLSHLFAP